MEDAHELKVVSIRLVDEPPLLSKKAIKNPRDVIEVMGEHLQKYDRELFCILNLQTKGQVINMNIVSMGTLNIALVHPREVFKSAILSNAAGLILLHNHPSGECTPSESDIKTTKQLVECGNLMQIPVKDHVIVGGGNYYSFRENDLVLPSTESIGIVAEQGNVYRADRTGRR